VKPTASTLVCAGCGWTAPPPEKNRYPFRCPKAGRGDTDHVVTRKLDSFRVEFLRGEDPNPFIRHRELLHSWHLARRRGLSDEAYVELVRELDLAITRVDGRGFRTTPFGPHPALNERLGLDVWVKDETGNVSGSHKARHLMGILLYLQVVERRERPPLAIASCGNAALAAAVLARAADRALQVFVPPDAEPAVLERLRVLGAHITSCPREPGVTGDPCVQQFRTALEGGALPFCCQGSENGLTIEGGETLGYEMITALGATDLDHVVIQVGGGALAGAVIQALRYAHRSGRLGQLPRLHTVQTTGAWPLKRAWDRIQEGLKTLGELDALERATKHRSEFMTPWEETPRSIAHGILDDETYDWLAIVKGMLASKGVPVVVSEDELREANALARETTGINVDHTGSAGLAGLMRLQREGVIKAGERVAVIFSGVARPQTA
jgi:threonine dehydratase